MAFESNFAQANFANEGGGSSTNNSMLMVKTSELREMAAQYSSHKANMIQECQSALAKAKSVVNNGWSGPTANVYLDRLNQIEARINNTIDRLYSNVSEAFNYAADSLEQAEQNNRDSLSEFGI